MDNHKLNKKIETLFIIFLILIGIYYIYLASITQMLGEDEDTYFSLAKRLTNLKYEATDSFGNPSVDVLLPLFMPSFYSFLFFIFGISLAITKSAVAFFGLLTLIVVYLMGRKFNIYFGFFSALILLSMTGFSHSSMLAYVEVPIAFFSILFIYFLSNLDIKSNRFIFESFIIGIVIGLSYYTKISGLILLFVLFLYCLILFIYKRRKEYIKLFLISLLGFLMMVSPLILRNLILYKYPFFEGLNYFFKPYEYIGPLANVKWVAESAKLLSPASISLETYLGIFGILGLILSIFGFSWLLSNFSSNLKETHLLFLLALPSFVFLIIFTLFNVTGFLITESRYLSIIFPQISILGGFFLWKLKERKIYFLIFIVPILIFALFSGITTAQSTSVSQRYPNNYIEALTWLKTNTPKDSIVFTAYGGSVDYFAERRTIWTINEFPDIMHSNDGKYIYDNLKKHNISYVLVWRGIVAQDYIVPQSNLIGAFTYNFVNVLSGDTENFEAPFQNQDNIIFKLK